ncbi:MAG: DUF1579 domain-containing protein [Bacteroidota bacterium]
MSQETFETSLQSGPHHFLTQLAGTWAGTTKTFFEPGILADESPWHGTLRPILDGMFILHEYHGSLQGKPLKGTALYGYAVSPRQFQSAWVDSFHNGTTIMFSQGSVRNDCFNVLGSYDAPDGSPPWGWRTEILKPENDQLIIRMYNITPEGKEALAVETTYHRIWG